MSKTIETLYKSDSKDINKFISPIKESDENEPLISKLSLIKYFIGDEYYSPEKIEFSQRNNKKYGNYNTTTTKALEKWNEIEKKKELARKKQKNKEEFDSLEDIENLTDVTIENIRNIYKKNIDTRNIVDFYLSWYLEKCDKACKQGTLIRKIEKNTKNVLGIQFTKDGQNFIAISDHTLRMWSADGFQEVIKLKGHYDIYSFEISPDGKSILTGGGHKIVRIFNDIKDPECENNILVCDKHNDFINSVSWNPNSKQFVSGCKDRSMRIWTLVDKKATFQQFFEHKSEVNSVAWNPTKNLIASGGKDKLIFIWKSDTGEIIKRY